MNIQGFHLAYSIDWIIILTLYVNKIRMIFTGSRIFGATSAGLRSGMDPG
jgi:hypothetical protein